MNTPLNRDAKSCLERWKNYLKPGIKKGSLTEEEQRLVINLQATHGNKWKKIAAQVPGRTAKRLRKQRRRGNKEKLASMDCCVCTTMPLILRPPRNTICGACYEGVRSIINMMSNVESEKVKVS